MEALAKKDSEDGSPIVSSEAGSDAEGSKERIIYDICHLRFAHASVIILMQQIGL